MNPNATHLSDINELALGWYLNGKCWWNAEAKTQQAKKTALLRSRISMTELVMQLQRAEHMADRVRGEWLLRTGKTLKKSGFTELYWVGRSPIESICPNAQAKHGHPADLLLSNQEKSLWLGISAKSYKTSTPHLKTLGLGTLDTLLHDGCHWTIGDMLREKIRILIDEHQLPSTAKALKAILRGSGTLKAELAHHGDNIATEARNAVFGALETKDQPALKAFLSDDLLDCGNIFPKYIRVMGLGTPATGYSAHITDPFAIRLTGTLTVQKVGANAIGFKNDSSRICLLRAKWESEPLASDFRFNVETWRDT